MTKNELLEVQNFIKEMRKSSDDIEVMNSIYVWIKEKYEEQGEKKLGEQYIKLNDIGNPEWGAPGEEVFIIKLGKRV